MATCTAAPADGRPWARERRRRLGAALARVNAVRTDAVRSPAERRRVSLAPSVSGCAPLPRPFDALAAGAGVSE
jgi:hypothetical protein